MERKFHQEKALREVAETRVKALKKKVRAYENNTNNANNNTNNTTTTNGSNGSITNNNNSIYHSNDTSIDAGYGSTGIGWMVGNGGMTRDDESVGTNQTQSDHKPPPTQHLPPTPSLPYSDQLQ
jgi:hypothetical protein